MSKDNEHHAAYLAFGRGFVSSTDNYGEADAIVKRNGNGCVYVSEHICDTRDMRHDAEVERLTSLSEQQDGVAVIAAERRRQLEKEGWTPEHDDHHTDQSLAQAAACYAWPPMRPIEVKKAWPWKPWEWKPELHAIDADENELIDARIRVLAKAGALIAAEIDRLRRTWAKSRDKGEANV